MKFETLKKFAEGRKGIFKKGQLKLSIYVNYGIMTVNVMQGRHLDSHWTDKCDSFVKICLVPDDSERSKYKTSIVEDSNNPQYDDKFSFEMLPEDKNKRMLISVWHRDQNTCCTEFLGCMSFGVKHLMNPKKETDGWYYLLTEDMGRKKHLQVSVKSKKESSVTETPQKSKTPATPRSLPRVTTINKDVSYMEPQTLTITRKGRSGFGFTLTGGCPVRVNTVEKASPAEESGLKPDDCLIRVNGQNISRSTAVSVAKIIKYSGNSLAVEVQRPRDRSILHNMSWGFSESSDSEDDFRRSSSAKNKTGCVGLPTRSPFVSKQRVSSKEARKHAIRRLHNIEMEYIDVMQAGIERYSRPLRHNFLSPQQHDILFQNIEKLVMISEFLVKQIQDNETSDSDSDTGYSNGGSYLTSSIGLIYSSKMHVIAQAYSSYGEGVAEASQLLINFKNSKEFRRFLKYPELKDDQPTIASFINKPVEHLKELHTVLSEICDLTPSACEDLPTMTSVVQAIQSSLNKITTNHIERVPSVSSLSSADSKDSGVSSRTSSSQESHSTSSTRRKKHRQGALPVTSSCDPEITAIQDKLVFAPNVHVFELGKEGRHLLYSGDMFKWCTSSWSKIHMLLFTDILLQVEIDREGFMTVIEEPLYLHDICGIDATRKNETEIILHLSPSDPLASMSSPLSKVFQTPTIEEKFTWKSLLKKRASSARSKLLS